MPLVKLTMNAHIFIAATSCWKWFAVVGFTHWLKWFSPFFFFIHVPHGLSWMSAHGTLLQMRFAGWLENWFPRANTCPLAGSIPILCKLTLKSMGPQLEMLPTLERCEVEFQGVKERVVCVLEWRILTSSASSESKWLCFQWVLVSGCKRNDSQ